MPYEGGGSITCQEFQRGCRALEAAWNSLCSLDHHLFWQDVPSLHGRAGEASGFLSACGVPCSSTAINGRRHEDAAGDTRIAELLGSVDVEEVEDDAAEPPHPNSPVRDYHIVYSLSYRCPVLLLRGRRPDGTLMSLSELQASLPSSQRQDDGTSITKKDDHFISQIEHPQLQQPWHMLNPCMTAELMDFIFPRRSLQTEGLSSRSLQAGGDEGGSDPGDGKSSELQYMLAWLSLVGPPSGLCTGETVRLLSSPPQRMTEQH